MSTVSQAPPSAPAASPADQLISERIAEACKALWWAELIRRSLVLVIALLLVLLAWVAIDEWLYSPGRFLRAVAWIALVAGTLWYVYRKIWPVVTQSVRPEYAARSLERDVPDLNQDLLSYITLRPDANSNGLRDRVVRSIGNLTAGRLKKHDALPTEATGTLRWWIATAIALALLAGYAVLSPKNTMASAARLLSPLSNIEPAKRVEITSVEPGDTEALAGRTVAVSAEVEGLRDDEPVNCVWQSASRENQFELRLNTETHRYEGDLQLDYSAAGKIPYRVIAGDDEAGPFWLNVKNLPVVAVQSVNYEPPAYTGKEPHTSSSASITGIDGTNVTIRATSNRPVARAMLEFNPKLLGETVRATAGSKEMSIDEDGTTLTMTFPLRSARGKSSAVQLENYRIRVWDDSDQTNQEPIIYPIRVVPDLAPEIAIVLPRKTPKSMGVNLQQIIEVHAMDPDFGLKKVELEIRRGIDVVDKPVLWSSDDAEKGNKVTEYRFRPSEHRLRVGDVVRITAIATDNRLVPGDQSIEPNVTVTDPVEIRVIDDSPTPDPQGADDGVGEKDNQPATNDPNQKDTGDPSSKSESKEGNQKQSGSGGSESKESGSKQGQGGESSSGSGGESGNQPKDQSSEGSSGQKQESGSQGSENNSNSGEGSQSNDPNGQSGQPKQGDQNSSGQNQPGDPSQGESGKNGSQQNGSQNSGSKQNNSQQSGDAQNNQSGDMSKDGANNNPQNSGGDPSAKQPQGNGSNNQQQGDEPSSANPQEGTGNQGEQATNQQPNQSGAGGDQTNPANGQNQSGQSGDQPNDSDRGAGKHDGETFEKIQDHIEKKRQQEGQPGSQEQGGSNTQDQAGNSQDKQEPGRENSAGGNSQEGSENSQDQSSSGDPSKTPNGDGKNSQKDAEGGAGDQSQGDPQNDPKNGSKGSENNSQGDPKNGSESGSKSPNGQQSRSEGADNKQGSGDPKNSEGSANGDQSQSDSGSKKNDNQGGGDTQPDGQSPKQEPGDQNKNGQSGKGGQDSESMDRNDPGKQGSQQNQNGTGDQEPTKQEPGEQGSSGGDDAKSGQNSNDKGSDPSGKGQQSDSGKNGDSNQQDPNSRNESDQNAGANDSQSGDSDTGKQGQNPSGDQSGQNDQNGKGDGNSDQNQNGEPSQNQGGDPSKSNQPSRDSQGKNNPGKNPNEQTGDPQGDSKSGNSSSEGSSASDSKTPANQSKNNQNQRNQSQGNPQGGQSSGQASDGEAGTGEGAAAGDSPPPKPADLEYTKKATDMVLDYLEETRDKPDRELLEKLDWTEKDMKEFSDRWQKARQLDQPTTPDAENKEIREALESLGMRPSAARDASNTRGTADNLRSIRDSGNRRPAPAAYRDIFDAFRRGNQSK